MIAKWLSRMFSLGIAGAVLLLVAGTLGFLHPAFDTAAHFRLHVSVLLLLACLGLCPVLGGMRRCAIGLLAGFAGIFFSFSAAGLFPHSIAAQSEEPVHTMLHLNLMYDHPRPQPVIDRILHIDADILSLSETFGVWNTPLNQLNANWPHQAACGPNEEYISIRIYSKFPIDNSGAYCGPFGTFLKTKIGFPSGVAVDVGSVHTRWPWPASGPKQYEAFQPVLKQLDSDALIAGDFNATPWSFAVTRFARTGGLQRVAGVGSTWLFRELPGWMIKWVGLPIDHIMQRGRVQVLSAHSLEPVGSDHLPVLVQFRVQ